jgi:cell wall-associated NlpC family hydrolase
VADRQDSDREVLTSLPRSRPVRRSAKRAARPASAAAAEPKAEAAASPGSKAGKPSKAAAAAKPAAKPRSRAKAQAKATAAEPKVAPTGATAGGPPRKIPPAGYASPSSRAEADHAPGSADIVGTAVQAATELAQIGFAVGRQALQSMIDRLPKP